MDTLEEMNRCIDAWLLEYSQQAYIRFTIVDKSNQKPIGTIEMFGKIGQYKTERGILRIDIASTYENKTILTELVNVCVQNFYNLFAVEEIATKAIPKSVEMNMNLPGLNAPLKLFKIRACICININVKTGLMQSTLCFCNSPVCI